MLPSARSLFIVEELPRDQGAFLEHARMKKSRDERI
jgi:hypothetical protein